MQVKLVPTQGSIPQALSCLPRLAPLAWPSFCLMSGSVAPRPTPWRRARLRTEPSSERVLHRTKDAPTEALPSRQLSRELQPFICGALLLNSGGRSQGEADCADPREDAVARKLLLSRISGCRLSQKKKKKIKTPADD